MNEAIELWMNEAIELWMNEAMEVRMDGRNVACIERNNPQ